MKPTKESAVVKKENIPVGAPTNQDVELAQDEEIKKNTPNTRTRVQQQDNIQKNINHIRNKQLY